MKILLDLILTLPQVLSFIAILANFFKKSMVRILPIRFAEKNIHGYASPWKGNKVIVYFKIETRWYHLKEVDINSNGTWECRAFALPTDFQSTQAKAFLIKDDLENLSPSNHKIPDHVLKDFIALDIRKVPGDTEKDKADKLAIGHGVSPFNKLNNLGQGPNMDDLTNDIKGFSDRAESAVGKGSDFNTLIPLIETWEIIYRDKADLIKKGPEDDQNLAGNVTRFVAMLYLHGGSYKIKKNKEGEGFIRNGYSLINEAIKIHQTLHKIDEEALDHLHLGAYQCKIEILETKAISNKEKKALYIIALESIENAIRLFKEVNNVPGGYDAEYWKARLEINLGSMPVAKDILISLKRKSVNYINIQNKIEKLLLKHF